MSQIVLLRAFSWVFGFVGWFYPICLFGYEIWNRKIGSSTIIPIENDNFIWFLSTALTALYLGAFFSLCALMCGIVGCIRDYNKPNYNSVLRLIEIIVIAIPLSFLFFFI